jgi:signal peptidase I
MLRKYLLRWEVIVGAAALFVVAFIGMRIFVFDFFRVPSGSMHPTIPKGSIIVVKKWGYGNYGAYGFIPMQTQSTGAINRGDIVIYRLPANPSVHYVHRVIGLPGDHISYANHRLRINGTEARLTMGDHEGMYQYATEVLDGREATLSFVPERYSRDVDVTVPKDHLFMLGDSRDNAQDSRFEKVGFVPRANVIGVHVRTFPSQASTISSR